MGKTYKISAWNIGGVAILVAMLPFWIVGVLLGMAPIQVLAQTLTGVFAGLGMIAGVFLAFWVQNNMFGKK